jgi:uncharacterized protein YdhG (YjbR/CyaY superfamily)
MASSKAATVAQYLAELPADRRTEIEKVRDTVNAALPAGYREGMGWGMIGWVVPLEDYPGTYNGQPAVYAGLAAQKNYNSLYLNCVYASPERTARLRAAFARAGKKLDMGKSCIRFQRADDLPLDDIAAEIASTTPADYIRMCEDAHSRGRC